MLDNSETAKKSCIQIKVLREQKHRVSDLSSMSIEPFSIEASNSTSPQILLARHPIKSLLHLQPGACLINYRPSLTIKFYDATHQKKGGKQVVILKKNPECELWGTTALLELTMNREGGRIFWAWNEKGNKLSMSMIKSDTFRRLFNIGWVCGRQDISS